MHNFTLRTKSKSDHPILAPESNLTGCLQPLVNSLSCGRKGSRRYSIGGYFPWASRSARGRIIVRLVPGVFSTVKRTSWITGTAAAPDGTPSRPGGPLRASRSALRHRMSGAAVHRLHGEDAGRLAVRGRAASDNRGYQPESQHAPDGASELAILPRGAVVAFHSIGSVHNPRSGHRSSSRTQVNRQRAFSCRRPAQAQTARRHGGSGSHRWSGSSETVEREVSACRDAVRKRKGLRPNRYRSLVHRQSGITVVYENAVYQPLSESAVNLNAWERPALSLRLAGGAEFHSFQNSLKQPKVLAKELGPCP